MPPDHGEPCAVGRKCAPLDAADGLDRALAQYQTTRDELSVRLFTITDEIASSAWDMCRLQALHKALSDEMANEVLHVAEAAAEDVHIFPIRHPVTASETVGRASLPPRPSWSKPVTTSCLHCIPCPEVRLAPSVALRDLNSRRGADLAFTCCVAGT